MKYFITIATLAIALGALATYIYLSSKRSPREQIVYRDVTPLDVAPLEGGGGDSLYFFRDTLESRWSAEIEGQNVAIRSLVLRDEEPREASSTSWEVALRTGVATNNSAWYGLGLTHRWNNFSITFTGGYDYINKSPFSSASASIVLFDR